MTKLEIVSLSEKGLVRTHNEDAIRIDRSSGLILLADGMGGEKAGEVASRMAVDSVAGYIHSKSRSIKVRFTGKKPPITAMNCYMELVEEAIEFANTCVYQRSISDPQCRGMGTTLVAGLFKFGYLVVGHIGDSRLYRFRNGNLKQLTSDHSYVQELVDKGQLSRQEAEESLHRNIITRAVGSESEEVVDLATHGVEKGDVYLFCSDGLTDLVPDREIREILTNTTGGLATSLENLTEKAHKAGGDDNISIILIRTVTV